MAARRKKYRPREALPMPLSWGMSDAAKRQLREKELLALNLLLENQADESHVVDLETACVAAVSICAEVVKAALPQFDPMAVHELRQQLEEGGRAIASIKARAERVGRYGCSGPERELLQAMYLQIDALRDQVPRRLMLAGYQATLRKHELQLAQQPRSTT